MEIYKKYLSESKAQSNIHGIEQMAKHLNETGLFAVSAYCYDAATGDDPCDEVEAHLIELEDAGLVTYYSGVVQDFVQAISEAVNTHNEWGQQ